MADETQQTTDLNAVIEELRKTNAQLTEKSKTRKLKIAELEAANTALTGQLRQITVDTPMRALAAQVCGDADLFMEQFSKSQRVEMIDNKLTIVSAETGKPINVELEREALLKHLTDDKHPQAKIFRTILIASRASGGASAAVTRQTSKPVVTPKRFGLR